MARVAEQASSTSGDFNYSTEQKESRMPDGVAFTMTYSFGGKLVSIGA